MPFRAAPCIFIAVSFSPAELQSSLAQFAAYARSLKGDEKGEAQLFLERFFQALGHKGIKEAGATLEFRIAKKPGSAQLELIKDDGAAAKTKAGGDGKNSPISCGPTVCSSR